MIIGVGTDIIEIARVRKLMEEPSGPRFVERVLTPDERKLAEQRQARLHEYVAGRFAAKEAVAKALGCGIGRQVGFQDIGVLPDSNGQPQCRLSEASLTRLGLANIQIHLSISHSETMATAFAVIERAE
ncbi:4'-phosphopantetheinyl transferase [Chlamydia abortus]|uniref:Holo-[acyl-carrier-protein] synthase n=1 Tax=Paenibacillus residui TaxID=629724 RepID=A0ABW3D5A6_9BACL|nr:MULTISPECIES: holo-ACP synthase [Paenibacillaceae]SHE12763.1 4'-phosphopantetheinyl transferase [Chlamydia abortus]